MSGKRKKINGVVLTGNVLADKMAIQAMMVTKVKEEPKK